MHYIYITVPSYLWPISEGCLYCILKGTVHLIRGCKWKCCYTLHVMELSVELVALPPGETAVNAVIESLFAGKHVALKDSFERDFFAAPLDYLIIHLQQKTNNKKNTQTCRH